MWGRGELWLDTDVLWFREVPALARVARAPVATLGPPPGLIASQRRRDAWKRRRYARRARATAFVLSPTLVVALATLRSSAGDGAPAAVEDPPSLTFVNITSAPLFVSKPKANPIAREDVRARIEWHHAIPVGLPFNGHLIDGTQLPVEAPDWVTWNPVTDSVPNAAKRLYGSERTIRAIVSATEAYRAANPEAPRVVIGDISREGGGPMWDEHVSHQNGLDVDVYFPRRDRTLRAAVASDQIDHRLAQDLLERFVAVGAQMVFVGYATGLHGPAGVVIPHAGHEYHMHVRFPPPGG